MGQRRAFGGIRRASVLTLVLGLMFAAAIGSAQATTSGSSQRTAGQQADNKDRWTLTLVCTSDGECADALTSGDPQVRAELRQSESFHQQLEQQEHAPTAGVVDVYNRRFSSFGQDGRPDGEVGTQDATGSNGRIYIHVKGTSTKVTEWRTYWYQYKSDGCVGGLSATFWIRWAEDPNKWRPLEQHGPIPGPGWGDCHSVPQAATSSYWFVYHSRFNPQIKGEGIFNDRDQLCNTRSWPSGAPCILIKR